MRAFLSDFGHVPHSTEANVSSFRSSLSTGLSSVSCSGGYVSILDVVAAETLNLKTVPTLAVLPLETSAKVLCSVSIDEAGLWVIGSSSGIYIFDNNGIEGTATTIGTQMNSVGGEGAGSQFVLVKFIATHTEVKCLDAAIVKLPAASSFGDPDEFQQHALLVIAGGSFGAQVHIWSPLPQRIAARLAQYQSTLYPLGQGRGNREIEGGFSNTGRNILGDAPKAMLST